MAVEDRLLGQQVRCPHCQQVVVVPASTSATSSSSEPTQPASAPAGFSSFPVDFPTVSSGSTSPHHEDDIFMSPVPASDDLFGGIENSPVVEMPPEPEPQGISQISYERFPAGSSEPLAAKPENAPVTEVMNPVSPSPNIAEITPPSSSTSDWPETSSSSAVSDFPPEMVGTNLGELPRQVTRRAKAEGLFSTYLIIFLVPYAIFVTCIAAYFYWRMLDMQQRAPHPLEYLRDTGENPPAKRGTSSVIESISPETNLPLRLQVALGERLRIGDLEVWPLKVERKKLTICSENRRLQPQETSNDALVLTLRLRNVSSDVLFTPTDPHFDRQWKEEYGSSRPYTLLEIGDKRFFGGPIQWRPRTNRGKFRADDPREYVKGQENDNQILKPGTERTSILCTDPGNREILKMVQAAQGPLVWRVHLRRGLVDVGDREVSATAVVGVVFDKKDILMAKANPR
jgi:hypothetical protein